MTKASQRFDGKWNCTVRISDGWGFVQCSIPAKHDLDNDGNPTRCHVHSIAGEKRRAEQKKSRDAKWRAECAAKQEARRVNGEVQAARKAALEACRKIAAGHNDPRTLAASVIAMLPPEAET